ncbi:MAG TPA: PepSY domain-containing protein [Microvirga sp.]|jgi:hypothetical protein
MRLALATLAAVAALSTAALAQTNTQPNAGGSSTMNSGANSNSATGTANPAVDVKPKGSPETTGAVTPGANSFTEGQARSRIEAQGFANVMDLKKDDQGVWRGRAMRNGQSTSVMLDFRGNVSAQ